MHFCSLSQTFVCYCRTAISSLKLKDVKYHDVTLLCDVSLGKSRPILPQEFSNALFEYSRQFMDYHIVNPNQPRELSLRNLFGMDLKKT